jgi:hypothetical protein
MHQVLVSCHWSKVVLTMIYWPPGFPLSGPGDIMIMIRFEINSLKFAAEIQHCRRHIRSFMERELRQVMRYNEEHPTARQVTARQAELERELEEMEQRRDWKSTDREFFRQGLEVDKDWATGQN